VTARLLLGLVAGVVLLAGCSGDPTPSSTASATPSHATASTDSDPEGIATTADLVAPLTGACYRLTTAELTRPTNNREPVPCGSSHTSRTIYVGQLTQVANGRPASVDSTDVQRQLARTCPAKLAAYVGGSRTARELSRIHVVWFSPTVDEGDRGANWFRCDVVAFARAESLMPLTGSLEGVLDRPGALDTYGLCGTAAPGTSGFVRVACSRRHSWRAFSTLALRGGTTYPGMKAVRGAGDTTCKDRARARASNALKFSYGWEWPTAEQWSAGQHYGYCWAPG